MHRVWRHALTAGICMALLACTWTPKASTQNDARTKIPIFAYYYIWFDAKSWERAKTDLPLLGKYSSDDEDVIRQHVRWAKESGIDGFIVGWKGSDKLDARLEKMLRIADAEEFKILMIYQALDFYRNPLPIEKISADLDVFINTYLPHKSLHAFGKPIMIWSGTWKYTTEDIANVTEPRRHKLHFLGTAKNINDYSRIKNAVEGNAYYWSSVNVDTNPNYESKLNDMSETIHQHGGFWLAPAASGFDARLVGGTSRVDRKQGETLRAQLCAASASSPDAIGLISWNEFSENSHIEPSLAFGHHYLDLMKDVQATRMCRA